MYPTTASGSRSPRSSSSGTAQTCDERALIDHVKGRLASYKAPRQVLQIDTIGRAANGKVDYKRLQQFARDQVRVA